MKRILLTLYALWQSEIFRIVLIVAGCLVLSLLIYAGIYGPAHWRDPARYFNAGGMIKAWIYFSAAAVLLYFKITQA
jgi:hypothetical protein